MSLVLHQFPISHYCEKARWALDYKGLDYRLRNHLPGLHVRKIRKVADRTTVPVLEHDGKFIQGSAAIISHLDDQFPQKPLTPSDGTQRSQALEWERYFDADLGPHVRRFCYDTLLKHPGVVVPMLAQDGPIWGGPFLRLMFPKLQKIMRRTMKIREPEVSQSREALESVLERLNQALEGRDYLVGNQFTRADLTAASLLAPLFMPEGYGINWPDTVPSPLKEWIDEHDRQLDWARRMYQKHRS